MNDEFLQRLSANDPASGETPDLTGIKARVDAHTADNIVPLARRRDFSRGLRVAAAVGALALAGGAGFAGGSLRTAPTSESLAITSDARNSSGVASSDVAPQLGMGGVGGAGDAKMAAGAMGSFVGWGGTVILTAAGSVGNDAGTAASYRLSSEGVDRAALIRSIAKLLGMSDVSVTDADGALQINGKNGGYNAYVGSDAQVWFNGYNNDVSPWACESQLAGVDASGNTKTEITQEMSTKCDALWPAPAKEDAIAAAKAVFTKLGLDGLAGAKYVTYGYNSRATTVTVTPVIDGLDVAMQWSAEVGKDGVFSISGAAARLVKDVDYPTVGARSAAARSELRKWMSFGPSQVWAPEQNLGVTPTTSVPATTPMRDGKPMLQAYLSNVTVSAAKRALMQVYLADGTTMLMPAWNFTAADGSVWQMIAITDDFIDWTQAAYNGPIAYAAREGVATDAVAMPMMK